MKWIALAGLIAASAFLPNRQAVTCFDGDYSAGVCHAVTR